MKKYVIDIQAYRKWIAEAPPGSSVGFEDTDQVSVEKIDGDWAYNVTDGLSTVGEMPARFLTEVN